MKKKGGEFTDKQIAELNFVESLPEDQINVKEIPEMSDWSGARRGFFYKPIKQQATLRLDSDIIHWFKARMKDGRGCQTEINRALRNHISRRMNEFEMSTALKICSS